MPRISSTSNPQIKQIRALRQRKEREARELYYIEGIRIVAEAAQLADPIETLVIAPELLSSPFGQQLAAGQRHAGARCLEVSAEVFRSLSARDGPQGLAAVLRQRWSDLEEVGQAPDPQRPGLADTWVALSEVADPGNLGAILRTGDAVGAAGVILLGDSTDPYDPSTIRASMGAIFAQRLVRASFAALMAWKRRSGVHVVGTSSAAAVDYQALTYPSPMVLLMGSERQGLSAEQRALCDAVVAIPMVGRSDSLNLAVATAIVLYEIFYQQTRGTRTSPPDTC